MRRVYQLSHRMHLPVGAMLDSMSADELVHHLALFDIDPWTEDRNDWRMAMVCMVIANCLTGTKHKIEDFMPEFKAAAAITTEVDDDKLLLDGMKWAAMMGGTIG